jgi:hypothetical protein
MGWEAVFEISLKTKTSKNNTISGFLKKTNILLKGQVVEILSALALTLGRLEQKKVLKSPW